MTQHETSQPSARNDGSLAGLCSDLHNLGAALILVLLMLTAACSAHAQIQASQVSVGARPYMGWSSWSMQDKFDSYPFGGNSNSGEAAGDGFQNEWNIRAQSDAMRSSGLQAAGFKYINIDGDWDDGLLCNCGVPVSFDQYGRPVSDPVRFPSGMEALAAYIHANGQKAGIYWEGGIPDQVYAANSEILGTSYHVQDIAQNPPTRAWANDYYNIDFTKPGAQEYINSIVSLFASWGYDYIKLDGIGTATTSAATSNAPLGVPVYLGDIRAYYNAVQTARRPMYINLSASLDHNYAGWWEQYANGRRVDGDIECSTRSNAACSAGSTTGLANITNWANTVPATTPPTPPKSGVVMRFTDMLTWQTDSGVNRGWNDFDSLEVGNGTNDAYPSTSKEKLVMAITPNPTPIRLAGLPSFVDGLTNGERQSAVTLWSIAGSALQLGDDLTNLDAFGIQILTNPEVIAVDQSGRQGHVVYLGGNSPIVSATPGTGTSVNASAGVVTPSSTTAIGATPVYEQTLCDGSKYVALFNLGASAATVTVNWADLGFSGSADVRDLWAREDLGVMENRYSVNLNPHASSLVHVKPVSETLLTPDRLDDACSQSEDEPGR